MEIDQLPVEMLMKVFSYLTSYKAVSLVSKLFYDVGCKVNVRIGLYLNERFFEQENDRQLLQSIHNSKRQISGVIINFCNLTETQVQSTISVIEKFSATIKFLRLTESTLKMSDYLKILSLVPNAEYLHIETTFGNENEASQKKDCLQVPSNEDLNLHHMNTLYFWSRSEEFLAPFNRLPAGVLRNLSITHFNVNFDALRVLFKRQTNIKNLHLPSGTKVFPADIFDNLELESFILSIENNAARILSKQTKLKILLTLHHPEDVGHMNDFYSLMDHFTELETFSIRVSESHAADVFVNINKLKKLKDLTLRWCDDLHLESFCKLDNSRINNLNLISNYVRSVDVIGALAKSVPNLKVFRMGCFGLSLFNAIMRSFNFVEVLQIEHFMRPHDNDVNHLIQGDGFNPKLVELNIKLGLPVEAQYLKKLTVDYPNLRKLTIRLSPMLSSTEFQQFLNEFTKLETLEINCYYASKASIDDYLGDYLHYIADHKNNLKCVTFSMLEVEFKLELKLKEKLCASFDVVHFRPRSLSMADYRNILKRVLWK